MVDEVSVGISAVALVLVLVFYFMTRSLVTKKFGEATAKVDQSIAAIMATVEDLTSKIQTPQPTAQVTGAQQEAAGISMEGGLGGQVGSRGSGGGMAAAGGGTTEALQPGKRYKYVMDPATRKMKLVPAD